MAIQVCITPNPQLLDLLQQCTMHQDAASVLLPLAVAVHECAKRIKGQPKVISTVQPLHHTTFQQELSWFLFLGHC